MRSTKATWAILPRIHFDQHLYQPLLVESADKITLSPPGLNEGEKQFVNDLKAFWAKEKDNALADTEVFLLRNQGRGKGVGFFENSGFYPDFILWIKTANEQRIAFIEPHGMLNAVAYMHDHKAQLHERFARIGAQNNPAIRSAEGASRFFHHFENALWGIAQALREWLVEP